MESEKEAILIKIARHSRHLERDRRFVMWMSLGRVSCRPKNELLRS